MQPRGRASGVVLAVLGIRAVRCAVRAAMLEDRTFAWRVVLGGGVLIAFAIVDRVRTGNANRFRELGFLLATALATMAYAVAHDAITWHLARDYFAIGKGLSAAETSFAPVADLALRAGWTAGLAVGLVLLVSNNPSPKRPQLSYRALTRHAVFIWLASVGAAVVLAGVGFLAAPFVAVALGDAGVASPREYATVQGAHFGSYAGALAVCVVTAVRIQRARRIAATTLTSTAAPSAATVAAAGP